MKFYTDQQKHDVLDQPFAQIYRKINVLLTVGELLMENGANTSYIIQQMHKASAFMGIPKEYLSIHVTYTTLMINVSHEKHSYTSFRKTPKHGVNMTVVYAVTNVLWRALERNYSLESLEHALAHIQQYPPSYSVPVKALASAAACGGFSILFGGTMASALMTIVCAFLGFMARHLCFKNHINPYVATMVATFVCMVSSYGFYKIIPDQSLVYTIISCTLFMIPGIPLINGIIDIISDHFMAGVTRLMSTLLIMSSMSLGIAIMLQFNIDTTFFFAGIKPNYVLIEQLLAGFVAASLFAVIFNTPYRLLPYIGLGGIVCVGVRNILFIDVNLPLAAASFIGSAVSALLIARITAYLKGSTTIMIIASVIPLIPGVLLYRFISDAFQFSTLSITDIQAWLQVGITGFLTVIGIASGAAVPNILADRTINRLRQARIDSALKHRQELSEMTECTSREDGHFVCRIPSESKEFITPEAGPDSVRELVDQELDTAFSQLMEKNTPKDN